MTQNLSASSLCEDRAATPDGAEPVPVSGIAGIPSAEIAEGILSAMRAHRNRAYAAHQSPWRWHISSPVLRDLAVNGYRPSSFEGVPIIEHDEWSWGWMLETTRGWFNPADARGGKARRATTGTGVVREHPVACDAPKE